MEQRPIAIAGMHRTGTSMVTRALHDSGLHLLGAGADAFIDAAEDNPEGFWENAAIVACNDDLLEATGGAWDNPPSLPPQGADDPRVAHLVDAAHEALAGLRELGQKESGTWGFKDPRTSLTAPFWMDLEPDLQFMICVRHPIEVALSLKRRNQNSYSLGLSLWEKYYATLVETVPRERRLVTHYDAFFADPAGELARLCDFAGLDPAEPRVRADLRHHDIDVGLVDAGASPALVALYAELCREADVAVPAESPRDEGRVRRLVLDGAVARQHAAQRQQAIERLEQRLRENQAEHKELWEKRSQESQRREEEARQRQADAEALQRRRQADTEALQRRLVRDLAEINQRTRRTDLRVERAVQAVTLRSARRALRRWARRSARLGEANIVKPGKRIAKRGARVAVPRAKVVVVPRARSVAKRLPDPAQDVLRRGRTAARARTSRRRANGTSRSAPKASGEKGSAPGTRAARGTTPKNWQRNFEKLVGATVPEREPWLICMAGTPGSARRVGTEPGSPFPAPAAGGSTLPALVNRWRGTDRWAGAEVSLIAQLEARRYEGFRRLVVPVQAGPWFARRVALRGHVTSRYAVLADNAAGTVFDLGARAATPARSLLGEVAECAGESGDLPAVLDWTDAGVAAELPGVTTFRAPAGERLPYLDSSVAVVVVDEMHDGREAARVAWQRVITIGDTKRSPGASTIVSVDTRAGGNGEAPHAHAHAHGHAATVVVCSADPNADASWRAMLADASLDAGAELRFGDLDAAAVADCLPAADVLVLVEPYVVPLPGAIELAATLALADPTAAVAGKTLRADGLLESAGGTVFHDRSVALIANRSPEVSAPWHEYVRPVCWAPGLVAAASSLWQSVDRPADSGSRAFVREWCAAVWAQGSRVVYRPTVMATRVGGDRDEPVTPLERSAWQRVLDLRPARPADLGDGAWRYLLAHDDVDACRG